jgi:hypothetical protein
MASGIKSPLWRRQLSWLYGGPHKAPKVRRHKGFAKNRRHKAVADCTAKLKKS